MLNHTRRLTPEEIKANMAKTLFEADHKARALAKQRRENAARESARLNAEIIRREAAEFLARQDSPRVGASLGSVLLRASQKGMRVQGPGGRFLSVKRAAG